MNFGVAVWISGFAVGCGAIGLLSNDPQAMWPGILLLVAGLGWALMAQVFRPERPIDAHDQQGPSEETPAK